MSRFVDVDQPGTMLALQSSPASVIPDRATLSREELISQMKQTRIPWGPIGEAVYRRTYSQKKEDGRNETWPETVIRAVDGNLALVPENCIENGERERLYDLLLTFQALPAGRHLNASGMKGRQFLFNCHASGWDYAKPAEHFTFLFDQLMQGGGVGSNYSNRYLDQMPVVGTEVDLHIICRPDHPNIEEFRSFLSSKYQREDIFGQKVWQAAQGEHVQCAYGAIEGTTTFLVEDTREGWISAAEKVLNSAFEERPFSDGSRTVILDMSAVRRRGLPLKTSGGIACGPEPLVSSVSKVAEQLNSCTGRRLTTLDAMVIDHALSACVVAGGKRRSSRMAVKSWMDQDIFEFLVCKQKDGAHWTTNISVEVDDAFFVAYNDETSPHHDLAAKVMAEVVRGKRLNGEPGLWNRSLAAKGERHPERMYCPNPCGEIGLYMWENCNLGHINMGAMLKKGKKAMLEACRLMTRWLMRATFGDIPNPRQRAVVDENRRIGVGFFGFHEWLALQGIRYSDCWNNEMVINRLRDMRKAVDDEAVHYAPVLGIPVPVKTTTLAPTGTTASLPGTTGSGQAMMAPWFKRLVRYSSMDPELAVKRLEGYEVFVDDDAKNTDIVVFWCEDPLVAKVRASGFDPAVVLEGQYDVTFEDSLRVQAMLQDEWANNAISFTINLSKGTMPAEDVMEETLMNYLPRLKGTTVFAPVSRKNVPIQPISKAKFDAHTGVKQMAFVEDECKGGCPVG